MLKLNVKNETSRLQAVVWEQPLVMVQYKSAEAYDLNH
jgi:hypothetical protein